MPPEHDHLVSEVGTGEFSDRVVDGGAVGMGAIDDVELQLDWVGPERQQARDTAVVLVPHHHAELPCEQIGWVDLLANRRVSDLL